jgi:hypothetical protein
MTAPERISLNLAIAFMLAATPVLAADSPDSAAATSPAQREGALPGPAITSPGGQASAQTSDRTARSSRREVPHAGKLPAIPHEWNCRPEPCD